MPIISIIGAGPGAPDLITIRAAERLKKAEVLVWADSLVSEEIIQLAPKDCECIASSSLTLEEILKIIITKVQEGKNVVRLHDGDPCLYGALSEQITALNKAEIEVEVVPGVSAYQATAASLNAELTIPGLVQTIIISRAPGRTGKPINEKLEDLAKIGASLCLYLSARHVEEVEKTLLDYYPVDTPVAIGYRVSWKDEWIAVVPLNKMATTTREKRLIRTTVYIVSPALKPHELRSKLYNSTHKHMFRSSN